MDILIIALLAAFLLLVERKWTGRPVTRLRFIALFITIMLAHVTVIGGLTVYHLMNY
jgi:hypothetical protein